MTKLIYAGLFGVMMAGPASAQDSTWTWQKPIAAGKTLQIKGIVGSISATPASGNQAEVVAKMSSRRNGFDVEVHVVEHEEGVTFCAVYSDTNECDSSGRSYSNGDRDDRVDFEVRVPRGVAFRAQTVAGRVTATGLTADVQASSVSGDVEVETSGIVHASSVSGSVRAKMGRANWDGSLSMSSVSGDITIEIPGELNTEVKFNTVSGDFDSDWPVTVRSSGSRRGVNGTIGSGGRRLVISTVSGDVDLRRY